MFNLYVIPFPFFLFIMIQLQINQFQFLNEKIDDRSPSQVIVNGNSA